MRANVYQARSLIGSDASGLSDPFARVIIGEHCKSTQVYRFHGDLLFGNKNQEFANLRIKVS